MKLLLIPILARTKIVPEQKAKIALTPDYSTTAVIKRAPTGKGAGGCLRGQREKHSSNTMDNNSDEPATSVPPKNNIACYMQQERVTKKTTTVLELPPSPKQKGW